MESNLYLAELLDHHDCVILPELGGFVGSYSPASIHPVYHTFQPPCKKILFNINLRQNDGLLANHIAHAENIPFTEANEKVRRYVSDCRHALETRGQVLIHNVGRLYTGKEGTLQFDQEMRFNHLPESYGLQPFFSVPVRKEEKQVKVVSMPPAPVETEGISRRMLATTVRWAAAMVIPVGIAAAVSFSGLDRVLPGKFSYAGILSSMSVRYTRLFSEASKPPVPVLKAKPAPAKPAAVITAPVTQPAPEVRTEAKAAPEPAPSSAVAESRPFAVILGAFRVEDNARNLVVNLKEKGFDALVFDTTRGGLFRVAAGTFASREEALAALGEMKSQGYPGAWLLEK